jgi:transcriptional regulator with XRE-family HTH domain
VTTSNTGPLIPRRRLGAAFKLLREARGETLQQTSKVLMFSPSKLSRIENGSAGEPHPRDVRDLIAHFEVNGDEAAALDVLAEAGRKPGWWQLPPYEFTGDLDTFISYESAASRIIEYSPMMVSGLLQTQDYANAVLARIAPKLTAEEAAAWADGRLERQKQMRARRTPRTHIMDEAIFHRVVGSTSIMRTQINSLLEALTDGVVEYHIMPFTAGIYEALELTTTTVFSFDYDDNLSLDSDGKQEIISIERTGYADFLDRPKAVEKYGNILKHLSEYWLDAAASRRFIERTLQEWRD